MRHLAFITLWLFVFTVPWQNTLLFDEVGTVSQAIGIVAFLAAALSCLSDGKVRKPGGTVLLVAAFVVFATMSVLWSLNPDASIRRVLTLLQLLAMAWLVSELVTRDSNVDEILFAYVTGSLLSALAVFFQYALGNANLDARYAAQGFNPNDQALTLALAIPISVGLMVRSSRLSARLLYTGYLVVAPAAIALTGSRAGVMAGSVAFGMSLLGARCASYRTKALMLAAIVLCVSCVFLLVPESSWARILTIGEQVNSGDLNLRTTIWAAGAREFVTHPLLGVGEGAFLQVTGKYVGESFVAHNTFISVLVELGLVGFALFAALIARTAMAIWRMPSSRRLMWTAIATTWLVGVLAATWETQKVTWLLIALIAAQSSCELPAVTMNAVDEVNAFTNYELCS